MAFLPTQGPFVWGKNGEQLTPDQVERLRVVSALAGQRGSDTSPVGHWSQGLARLVDAWGGYKGNMRADREETEGQQAASDVISALLGQGGSSLAPQSAPQVASVDAGGIPDVSVPMVNPDVAGAFAGSAERSGQFPASLINSESGGNWRALNNEGYGGRLQFGQARLADAARAGVVPAGMTGAQFSRLSPDQQIAVENWHFADIDQQAQRMGLDQYIGQEVAGIPITQDAIRGMAHLGGIGGAAKFLQSGGQYNPSDSNGTSLADYAMQHGGASPVIPIGGAGAPPATGVSPVVQALMQAQSNPWVAKQYGPVLQALMGQEMQRQNASYEQQMRQQDPMYQAQLQQAQLQLEQMRNPAPPKPIEVGGVLLDPVTYQPIFDSRQGSSANTPAEIQVLRWRAEEAGLVPGTPEYQQFVMSGGKADGGEGPAAFQALHMQAVAAGFEPGTPEYQQFMATRGAGLAAEASAVGRATGEATASAPGDLQTAQNALDLIDSIRNDPARSRGTGKSSILNAIPGTAGYDFQAKVEQAKGGAFLTAVQTMKGLGALSNAEGSAATAAITRMNTALTEEGFLEALDDYEKIVRQGLTKAQSKLNGQGATPAQQARRRYNPQTGEFE